MKPSTPGPMRRFFSSLLGKAPGQAQRFHPSDTCPECGSRLMSETGDAPWRCPNLDCPAQIRARLKHWCSTGAMDIPGFDAELVARLVRFGLARDVAELYRIKPAELAGLEGLDANSARPLFDAIQSSRTREAWRVLYGLFIPGLDPDSARALCDRFKSVDNVLAAGAERLAHTPGVNESIARSVAQWQADPVNRRLVKRLFKAGLNFKA